MFYFFEMFPREATQMVPEEELCVWRRSCVGEEELCGGRGTHKIYLLLSHIEPQDGGEVGWGARVGGNYCYNQDFHFYICYSGCLVDNCFTRR